MRPVLLMDVYWGCMASNVLLTLNPECLHGLLKSKCSWTAIPNIMFVFPRRPGHTVWHFHNVSKKTSALQKNNAEELLYKRI